jgi:MFS family permease
VLGVKEPAASRRPKEARAPIRRGDLRRLGASYWRLVAVASVFTLARFSEAFLVLRATDVGLAVALVPLVLVTMNVVYALSAYPAGLLADRCDRSLPLAAGFVLLILADLVLAAAGGIVGVLVGVALWGLHMGLTQGILAALVADTTPPDLRGTAFGVFNLAGGAAMLLASLLAGALWDRFGAPATFLAGALITLAATVAMLLLPRRRAGA